MEIIFIMFTLYASHFTYNIFVPAPTACLYHHFFQFLFIQLLAGPLSLVMYILLYIKKVTLVLKVTLQHFFEDSH